MILKLIYRNFLFVGLFLFFTGFALFGQDSLSFYKELGLSSSNSKCVRNLPRVELYLDFRFELALNLNNSNEDGIKKFSLLVQNRSDKISYFNEFSILDRASGLKIEPVFWSDNYISFMPGESRVISGEFKSDEKEGDNFYLSIDGLNLTQTFPLNSDLIFSSKGYIENNKKNRFSIMTYNVAGLPGIVSQSRPEIYSTKISKKLTPYDIVLMQEDFTYHRQISRFNNHPFASSPSKEKVLVNDGLNRFSKFPIEKFKRESWRKTFGKLHNGSDALSAKGVSFGRHRVADGVFIDIYNLHGDAGKSEGDWTAKSDQIEQLIEFVKKNSTNVDMPIIIAGDFNLKQSDKKSAKLLKRLEDALGLTDTRSLLRDLDYDRIDKIYFRDGAKIKLKPLFYSDDEVDFRRFFSKLGYPLSDHSPVTVLFEWE